MVSIAVRNAVVTFMENYETCVPVPLLPDFCTKPLNVGPLKDSISTTAGNRAAGEVRARLAPIIADLRALQQAADAASDAAFRDALKLALQEVVDNATVTVPVSVDVDFPSPIGTRTVYDNTFTVQVLDAATRQKLVDAIDRVDDLRVTGGIVIDLESVLAELPGAEILAAVREEVVAGIANIPDVDELGYVFSGSGDRAFVVLGGETFEVAFNVFDPAASLDGLGELIAGQLVD